MTRLGPDFYGNLEAPQPDPRELTIGQVHIGLGAFHRAHQAVYSADAMSTAGQTYWGVSAFTQRSGAAAHRLEPQGGLYTVVERGTGAAQPRVVGAVREAIDGSIDPKILVDRLCDPAVHVVTLTVTEKGYKHDAVTRRLRLDDPEVAADLGGRVPRTVPGVLAHALARRAHEGAGPLTVVSCDNLPENGRLLRELVGEFADIADLPLDGSVAFPSTVVDRIVPATTPADIDRLAAQNGVRDEAPVICEPFRQWVIENDFAGPVPAWSAAGATYVDDVTSWELLKLRVLNASHSILAYVGLRFGYRRIADAIGDPILAELCHRFIDEDVTPSVGPPPGTTVSDYGESVLSRFANQALPHTTLQVAADGSQKVGPRLLETIRACAERGRCARWATVGVASWALHVVDPVDADARPVRLDDPRAGEMREWIGGLSVPAAARRLLSEPRIVGDDLAADKGFVDRATSFAESLHRHGTAALASEIRS